MPKIALWHETCYLGIKTGTPVSDGMQTMDGSGQERKDAQC